MLRNNLTSAHMHRIYSSMLVVQVQVKCAGAPRTAAGSLGLETRCDLTCRFSEALCSLRQAVFGGTQVTLTVPPPPPRTEPFHHSIQGQSRDTHSGGLGLKQSSLSNRHQNIDLKDRALTAIYIFSVNTIDQIHKSAMTYSCFEYFTL